MFKIVSAKEWTEESLFFQLVLLIFFSLFMAVISMLEKVQLKRDIGQNLQMSESVCQVNLSTCHFVNWSFLSFCKQFVLTIGHFDSRTFYPSVILTKGILHTSHFDNCAFYLTDILKKAFYALAFLRKVHSVKRHFIYRSFCQEAFYLLAF